MDKPELKPCPFCGGEAIVLHWDGTDTFSVGCVNTFVCHGGTHTSRGYQSEQEAAEAWNRRAELTGEWLEDEYEERIKPLCDEIKPWNGWISTSERLPEKFENVLLSTNGGLVEEGFYFETTEFHAIWKGVVTHGTYWDDEITAWMPLPKPYHTESEDK